MLITRIELENIKNYESAAFDLEPGVTAIWGPNGAGKTTILEGIAWALFDYLAYKKEDFLKRGTKRGSVRVTFRSSIDNREYTVYRDTASGYYIYDPVTHLRLVEQRNQVSQWIKQHMGVDPGTDLKSLFTSAIGVPQGTFAVDFAEQPAKRKLEFDKVLRVDEYQRSAEALRGLIKFSEGRHADLREEIARVETEVATLDALLDERARLDETVKSLGQLLPKAEGEREELRAELERLDELQRAIARMSADRQALSHRISESELRSASVGEEIEKARRAHEVMASSTEGFEAYRAALTRLGELETRAGERDLLTRQRAEAEHQLVTVAAAMENLQEKLRGIEADKGAMETLRPLVARQVELELHRSELQKSIGEMGALKDRKAAADEDLMALRIEYKNLTAQIEEAKKLKDQAEGAVRLEIEKRALEKEMRDKRVEFDRMGERKGEHTRTSETITRLHAELAALETQINHGVEAERIVGGLSSLEAEERQVLEDIARLRASIDRDRHTLSQISGGLCPLLAEPCQNMKQGQTLDQYFQIQLGGETERFTALESRSLELRSRIGQAREALPAYSALASARSRLAVSTEEVRLAVSKKDLLEKQIADATGSDVALRDLMKRIDEHDRKLRSAQEARAKFGQVPELVARQEALTRDGVHKKKVKDDLDNRLTEMEGLAGQLQETETALATMDDPRGRFRALESNVASEPKVQEEVRQTQLRHDALAGNSRVLATRLEDFAALDDEIASQRRRRSDNEGAHQAYLSNQPLAAMLPSKLAELDSLHQVIAADRGRALELERLLVDATSNYDPSVHGHARQRFEEAINRASALAFELARSTERLDQLDQAIALQHANRERLVVLKDDRRKCERVIELSDFIRDLLKGAGPHITDVHLQSISIEANQLYRDITGNPSVSIRWDAGYEIILEEDGHDRPFASLSGGEQMVAALAVRLALLKELTELRIAFFDEPTTNMDEERRRNLAQQIGRIKDFDQLFVISHDDTFEGYTDRVIEVGASGSEAGRGVEGAQ